MRTLGFCSSQFGSNAVTYIYPRFGLLNLKRTSRHGHKSFERNIYNLLKISLSQWVNLIQLRRHSFNKCRTNSRSWLDILTFSHLKDSMRLSTFNFKNMKILVQSYRADKHMLYGFLLSLWDGNRKSQRITINARARLLFLKFTLNFCVSDQT